MYLVSRILLAIAFVEGLLCLAMLSITWPIVGIIVALSIVVTHWRPSRRRGAYGTADWADEEELRQKGMIGTNKGLAVGRLVLHRKPLLLPNLFSVLNPKMGSQDACNRSIKRLFQILPTASSKGEVVRLSNAVHIGVFGPTGAGKNVSFIMPWLLETDESAIVLDYKGENARLTAKHRERVFGHRIVLLDPIKVVTQSPDCYNPLDDILKDSPTVIDDARDLAGELVVSTGEEREPHWNQSAEGWISATIAGVVQHGQPDNRSLQTVRDVLSNPDKIPQLIELLCQSGDMFARLGGQLAHFRDKELSSTLTTTNRHLRFLDTPAVAANTCRSTFDPKLLRAGKMTIYCIVPPQHIQSQTGLIRMWIGSLMRTVVRGGLQHG